MSPCRVIVDGHEIVIPVLLRQFGVRHGMLLLPFESITMFDNATSPELDFEEYM